MKTVTAENGAKARDSKSQIHAKKLDAKSNGSKTHGSKPNGRKSALSEANGAKVRRDGNVLLSTLIAFKRGNFSVRMPVDQTDLEGKIADALNDVLEINQKMVSEFERISRAVGKDGKITQRASIGSVTGAWADCVEIGEQSDWRSGAAIHRSSARDRRGGQRRSLAEHGARSRRPAAARRVPAHGARGEHHGASS